MNPRTLITVNRVLAFVNIAFSALNFGLGNNITAILGLGAAAFSFYTANNLEETINASEDQDAS